jgi:6-phospho-beta-glucosidase
MKRGGAYYSTVATQLINAYHNGLEETHILNIKHNGAVPSWDKDWVLEMPCQVGSCAISPIQTNPLPLECESLITRVKAYELLTVEAAVRGDRNAAYKALLTHPLGPPADKIREALDDMLETNRHFLPQFFS